VKKLKDEQGYAALVAIMVVLVLTMIGTNLLQTVMSSFTLLRKTEARGEAEYYARMGMDEAMARLKQAIAGVNGQKRTTQKEIQDAYQEQMRLAFGLDSDSSRPDDTSFTHTRTFNGVEWHTTREPVRLTTGGVEASYQIFFRRETKQAGEDRSDRSPIDVPFVEKVIFRVIGTSHSPREESRALEAVVYINTYPEELQYVLATKQEIVLNGAALVEGDTYSKASYRLRNVAMLDSPVVYNGQPNSTTIHAAYPSVIGQVGAEGTDQFFKDEDRNPLQNRANLQDAFSIAPTVGIYRKHTPHFDSVEDVKQTVKDFTNRIPADLGYPKTVIPDTGRLVPARLYGTHPNLVSEDNQTVMQTGDTAEINGDLLVKGKFEMLDRSASLLIKGGNLYIKGRHDGIHDGTASAYFRGNVAVEKGHYLAIQGDTVFENAHVDGIAYIDGNLTIQGQFDINGTLYVTGDVHITEDQDTSGIGQVSWEFTENQQIRVRFASENPSARVEGQFSEGTLVNGLFAESSTQSSCTSPCQSFARAAGGSVVRLTIRETDAENHPLGEAVYVFSEGKLIDRTMVILTQGQVAAYNLNENKESPKEIRAFLYSQTEPVTLYGICSNLQLIGGVYANKSVTLTAARSDATYPLTCSGPDETGMFTITQDQVPADPSAARLRLRFDYGMFESPPPGLPAGRTLQMKIMQYELDTFDPEE